MFDKSSKLRFSSQESTGLGSSHYSKRNTELASKKLGVCMLLWQTCHFSHVVKLMEKRLKILEIPPERLSNWRNESAKDMEIQIYL